MFRNSDIVCAIEFGTSKISVLIGAADSNRNVEIIGRGCVQSRGIIKGEITDAKQAESALQSALEEAENACGELANCKMVSVLVTGCGIESMHGCGSTVVKNDQRKVTYDDIFDAEENASIVNLSPEREIINRSPLYYQLDDRKVINPENMPGMRLDAHVHLVHGISSRIANFTSIVRNCGFDSSIIEVIFSPLAAVTGVVSSTEKDDGILLVDMGMGCTDFAVESDDGVSASGVLQIGFDHVANDLAIGLELPIDTCRKLLESGEISKARSKDQDTISFPGGLGNVRQIPVSSFETIIDCRLRETFEIIREMLENAKVQLNFQTVAITGGAALFPRTQELLGEVFQARCQKRFPADIHGAVTNLDNPRFSAVWGALKYAAICLDRNGTGRANAIDRLVNGINRLFDNSRDGLRNIGKSIKF